MLSGVDLSPRIDAWCSTISDSRFSASSLLLESYLAMVESGKILPDSMTSGEGDFPRIEFEC